MTHLIIDSEHDMEVNITYLTELAKKGGYRKHIDISFPSQLFAATFMENLVKNFSEAGVSKDCEMKLDIFVPGEDNE